MKKIFNIATSTLVLLVLAMTQVCFVSCKDDGTSSGDPVITAVRVCDPEKADSTFTKSSQGQVIAIIGQNLNNAIYVYINDQKVYFNSTMNTDHSIIVTVPTEAKGFELTAFNSELKDEIRVETNHGTATYAFKILGGYPSISRVQCDYPRKAGDVLNVYGLNLEAIEKIYFTDMTSDSITKRTEDEIGGSHVDVTDYKTVVADHHLNTKTNAYETTSQLAVTIPDLPYDNGSLVIQCAAGDAYISYGKTPGLPVITYISSDMPEEGEEVTISGREFVQVQSITYGDVVLNPGDFTVAETEDQITFVMHDVPTPGSAPTLGITTPGGTGYCSFYDYSTLLNDCENIDFISLGWDPSAEFIQCPYGSTGQTAHFNTYGQWWGQMLFFAKDWNYAPYTLPGYDVIPADASADDVYIAFETYDDGSDFNNGGSGYQGFFRVSLWGSENANTGNQPDVIFHNFAWDDYDAGTFTNPYGPILQDYNGEAHIGKWYRSVIKLSDMYLTDADGNPTETKAYSTYADFVSRGVSVMRFMSYTQGTKSGKVDVYMDNIRVIYVKK